MRHLRRYRYAGRRRAGQILPPCDPWAGHPLFDPSLELYRVTAPNITCGRAL